LQTARKKKKKLEICKAVRKEGERIYYDFSRIDGCNECGSLPFSPKISLLKLFKKVYIKDRI
jgi:hypothetical protein